MKSQTADKLRKLNRTFYDAFAGSFDASRGRTEPGLERILPQIAHGSRVLDVGCGHGRLAHLLPAECIYVGVDNSEAMLALARSHTAEIRPKVRLIKANLLEPTWIERIPAGSFDWIVMRAVMHHIPGYTHRRALLQQARTRLSPEGYILTANWQFLEIPRLRKRVLPWTEIDLSPGDVEPGDYLLDWQRDGYGIRYVHLVDENETRALAEDSGLTIELMFRADGHTNNLTLYAIMSKTSS